MLLVVVTIFKLSTAKPYPCMWLRMKKQLLFNAPFATKEKHQFRQGIELEEGSSTLYLNEQLCKPKNGRL